MKKLSLLIAAAALALSAGPALAKKQLVIVVKGLDNPFFEAINQGCQKWNKENANSEYECFYTGPASTSDEAGEAQIVQDMLGKSDTVAIAISPSNAKLIAQTIKTANPSIPVMTLDADLAAEDSALRKTYLGTDNYLMGYRIGEYIKKKKPNGGTVCTIQGNPGADNILRRAQGTRDALSGQKGLPALAGEGGWTEVAGCPVFTNDDGAKGVQAMTDILAANPKLDAFAIEGGWPLFGAPQPYRDLFKPLRRPDRQRRFRRLRRRHDRRRSGDRPRRSGHRARRPAAVRDGLQGSGRHDRPDRRQAGRGSGVHRPRRMHQGHGRHLHPEINRFSKLSRRAPACRAPFFVGFSARRAKRSGRLGPLYPPNASRESPRDFSALARARLLPILVTGLR